MSVKVTFRDMQRRRYGTETYVSREVFFDGKSVGTWEDWAQLWAKDLPRLKAGDVTAITYPDKMP